MLLSVWGQGRPFTGWSTVFARTSDRIRERHEPRLPHVSPHRLRHTMAMATMARLMRGWYEQAARQVRDTDDDAALAHYLAPRFRVPPDRRGPATLRKAVRQHP